MQEKHFTWNTPKGDIHGSTSFNTNNNTLYIDWIGHAENQGASRVDVGPKIMREILGDLAAEYPTAQRVSFDRISGMSATLSRDGEIIPGLMPRAISIVP